MGEWWSDERFQRCWSCRKRVVVVNGGGEEILGGGRGETGIPQDSVGVGQDRQFRNLRGTGGGRSGFDEGDGI